MATPFTTVLYPFGGWIVDTNTVDPPTDYGTHLSWAQHAKDASGLPEMTGLLNAAGNVTNQVALVSIVNNIIILMNDNSDIPLTLITDGISMGDTVTDTLL